MNASEDLTALNVDRISRIVVTRLIKIKTNCSTKIERPSEKSQTQHVFSEKKSTLRKLTTQKILRKFKSYQQFYRHF